jgi:hypothetical protein
MDFIKNGMQNLKGIGFGAAVPGLRDQVFNAVNNVTASEDEQKARIRSVLEEEEKKRKAASGMKKGGKVSSASKRGDGCCVKGKTKGRMV